MSVDNSSNKKSSIVVLGDLDGVGAHVQGSITSGSRITNKGNSCSQRERKLTILVILLSIICFGLVAYFCVSGPLSSLLIPEIKISEGGFTGICDTIECVDISYRSVHSGDFSQNPCEDFYSFACSKWQSENPISPEQLYLAANINQIRDGVDIYIKRLLDKPISTSSNDTKKNIYASPRAFYESCLNFLTPDESFIISDLANSLGGYKSVENWSESEFDLTKVILEFLRVNAAPLFDLTLDIDPRDRTKYALIVELPRPTSLVPNLFQPLSRQDDMLMYDLSDVSSDSFVVNESEIETKNNEHDMHLSSSTVDRTVLYKMIRDNLEVKKAEKLKAITAQIGKLLSLSEDEINSDANDISLFVANIEKIKPSQRSRKFWKQQNKVYNEFTIDSLQRLFGSIDWKVLLTGLVPQRGEESHNFSWENTTIYVPYPDYLRRLFQVIQFTNKRLLYNGMLVMYIKDMLSDIVIRKKDDEPRWKFCVHSAKSVFAMELSSLYLRSFDAKHLLKVKQDVEEIFQNVKESLIHFLNRSNWQDPKSRDESIKKVTSLKGNFIGPSFYLDEDYLDAGVKEEIRIKPKDFYSNVKLVYKIFREQLYALYLKKIDEDRATWAFVTFPFTVNAFYIQQFNSLVVPLAFLNPPHYVHGAPKFINYATIGLTIAHEALHSLDSSGSDFDANGKLIQWINGEHRGSFLKEKSSCVAKQYSDIFKRIMPFHNTNVLFQVDGNLTQNENLADIAGLQVALSAYEKLRFTYSESESKKLPGLSFNLEQQYFVAVAQAYCTNISPMGYIFLLEMDEHTPHPERINGMLMNIPEFSKAFGCSDGSKMNPTFKCSLW